MLRIMALLSIHGAGIFFIPLVHLSDIMQNSIISFGHLLKASNMQILLTSAQIQSRVQELGAEISLIYQYKPLTIIGVMTGGLIFVADLVRSIEIPHKIALIRASSYRGETEKPGELKLSIDPIPDIKHRDVLIVDDILDTGHTMHKLLHTLQQYEPASLKTLALLWKPSRTIIDIKPDYYGFQIADHFVIGYGLDYNDDYRHLPHIAIYEPTTK